MAANAPIGALLESLVDKILCVRHNLGWYQEISVLGVPEQDTAMGGTYRPGAEGSATV